MGSTITKLRKLIAELTEPAAIAVSGDLADRAAPLLIDIIRSQQKEIRTLKQRLKERRENNNLVKDRS